MITLFLNNQSITASEETSLLQLLEQQSLTQDMAIIMNNQFIPKAQYEHTRLQDGDSIEVLVPMEGG